MKPVRLAAGCLLWLVLCGASSSIKAQEPLTTVFTPVKVKTTGWLTQQTKPDAKLEESPADEQSAALLKQVEAAKTPEELQAAVAAWEKITGEPLTTASGRPRVMAYGPGKADGAWLQACARFLQRTGQSRFGDRLEEDFYSAKFSGKPIAADLVESNVIGLHYYWGKPSLAINLFEACTGEATLDDRPVKFKLESNYPLCGQARLTINVEKPATFGLLVRVPTTSNGLTVKIRDTNSAWLGLPGDWISINPQVWNDGAIAEFSFTSGTEHAVKIENQFACSPILPVRNEKYLKTLTPPESFQPTLGEDFPKLPDPNAPIQPRRKPAEPGKLIPPHVYGTLDTGKRRGFYVWHKFYPETWEVDISTENPIGEVFRTKVVPWIGTYRNLTYGVDPHTLIPGERVNAFMDADEQGEWGYVTSFQDELCQMAGHAHWWWATTVDEDQRGFKAGTFFGYQNSVQLPLHHFRLAEDCVCWVAGKKETSFPLEAGMKLRMRWAYHGQDRVVHMVTDDASLNAIHEEEEQAYEKLAAEQGLMAVVDKVEGETAVITVFSRHWRYGHRILPDKPAKVFHTAKGSLLPTGEPLKVQIVSSKVGGKYGSGPTTVSLTGDVASLSPLAATLEVIRLLPSELKPRN